jgi:Flp pilus assembly protein CpaB
MRTVFLFIAIAVSVAAAFFTYSMISGDPKPQADASLVVQPRVVTKEVPTKDVYVARREIKVGDMIQQDMLDRQPWPKHLIGPGFVVADNNAPKLIGMVARNPFAPGEVLLDTKLANPQDPSFVAASIPDGTRAVTIAVDAVSGVGGLIYPGDRVDVLLTHSLYSKKNNEREKAEVLQEAMDELLAIQGERNAQGNKKRKKDKELSISDRLEVIDAKMKVVDTKKDIEEPVTEMIVPDVRVLAVNQRVVMTGAADEKKDVPRTMTLEVLKEDAERLKLAEQSGKLSLILRSLHDKSAALPKPVADGDLSRTIPPGYFPKIYEFGSPYPKELLEKKKRVVRKAVEPNDTILVVRGVEVEEMDIENPEVAQ